MTLRGLRTSLPSRLTAAALLAICWMALGTAWGCGGDCCGAGEQEAAASETRAHGCCGGGSESPAPAENPRRHAPGEECPHVCCGQPPHAAVPTATQLPLDDHASQAALLPLALLEDLQPTASTAVAWAPFDDLPPPGGPRLHIINCSILR